MTSDLLPYGAYCQVSYCVRRRGGRFLVFHDSEGSMELTETPQKVILGWLSSP